MKEFEKEQLLDSLGNITLLSRKINSKIKNKPWNDKRNDIRDKCFLEFEEVNFLDFEELRAKNIKDRTDRLVEEFRKQRIFEALNC